MLSFLCIYATFMYIQFSGQRKKLLSSPSALQKVSVFLELTLETVHAINKFISFGRQRFCGIQEIHSDLPLMGQVNSIWISIPVN